jgi:hypothetical protein
MFASPLDHNHKVIYISAVGNSRFPLPVFSYSNGALFENSEVLCSPILPYLLAQVVPFHPRIDSCNMMLDNRGEMTPP